MFLRFPILVPLLTAALLLSSCDETSTAEKATRDKVLLMGIGTEPKTLDPQRATSVSEALVLQALFEGLCSADPNDDTIPLTGVARSWTRNTDSSEWIFNLRSSTRWSDGTPLTACDFVFAYHRLLHPQGGAKYADMLYVLKNAEEYNRDFRGYILCGLEEGFPQPWEELKGVNWQGDASRKNAFELKGLDKLTAGELREVKNGTAAFSWPENVRQETRRAILDKLLAHAEAGCPDLWVQARVGVEAPDEKTLRLVLRGPVTYLPLLTRHFTWMPVPTHILNREGDLGLDNTVWTKPGKMVSNGPFVLESWRFNDSLSVVKNRNYRRPEDVHLKGMKFLPIVNGFTETRMFFDGKLHATNNVPAEMMRYARKKGGAEFRLNPYYATTLYRFNTLRKPLDDKRVRQALSCAINQKELVDNVAQGAGTPAQAFTPPTSSYSPPRLVGHNPVRARELLAEAGFPGGKNFPKLTILTTSREVQKAMTEAVQAQWKKELGIEVEIRASEWASYKLAQQRGEYDIVYGNWSGDFPDPSTFLELWTAGNGNNNTGWAHPEYERLIVEARNTPDSGKRAALFADAEKILLEECPITPLYWSKRAYLLSSEVRGWGPLQLDTRPYSRLSLEESSPGTEQEEPAAPSPPSPRN